MWCFAGNMIFYRRLRKARAYWEILPEYNQFLYYICIWLSKVCIFVPLYHTQMNASVILEKKKWFIHVSGNAKQITPVSVQHKRFYFFALWQAILVVNGHSTNAKEVSHLTTHRTKKHKCDHWSQSTEAGSLSHEMSKPLALIKSEWSNHMDLFSFTWPFGSSS